MKHALVDGILAFGALVTLAMAAIFLAGAFSKATGWMEDSFGTDGWPIEMWPSAGIGTTGCTSAALVLGVLQKRQKSSVPWYSGLVVFGCAMLAGASGATGWPAFALVIPGVVLVAANRVRIQRMTEAR